GTEKPTPSAPSSRRTPAPRTNQQALTSAQASEAPRSDVLRGVSQRQSRSRTSLREASARGRNTINAAERTPAAETSPRAARTPIPPPATVAPASASGAS